jgi:4-hydroxybenzoyl-CoA reductase subunit beta
MMNRMPEFRLARPATCAEAAALLAAEPGARLLAGGTDLVPNLRRGLERPPLLVDLGGVAGFAEVEFSTDGLVLGAGVTLARLAADEHIASDATAIGEAARAAAGPGHRTVATLGGNLCLDTRCVFYNQSEWWRQANAYCLKRGGDTCHVAPQGQRCHAAFSGDLAPALIALAAEVELLSCRGTRRVPLADCYRDDGAAHLTMARDEIVVRVRVPAAAVGRVSGYRKARVRGAMDFPLAGVACALRMAGDAIADLRVALTGTNSQPLLLQGTEALLGKPLDEAGLAALGKLVHKQVSPMRTTVSASNYRRLVAAVHAQRLLRELAAGRAH